MFKELVEILRRRGLLKNLVLRQLKVRYKSSFLGFFWSLLNPFLIMLVYWAVFSTIWAHRGIENYKAYLVCGLFPWYFFAGSLTDSVNSIIGNANLVKKIYFPRIILPLSVVFTNLVNFVLTLFILFLLLFLWKVNLTIYLWMFPLIIFIEFLLAIGFAFFIASLNVFFRDLEHMIQVILLAWFFLTPAIYPYLDVIPGKFHKIYLLNPMACVIFDYQSIFYYGQFPGTAKLLWPLFCGVFLFVGGYCFFARCEAVMVDQL